MKLMKQKGISQLILLGSVALLLGVFLVLTITKVPILPKGDKTINTKEETTATQNVRQDCKKTDYAGCDSDKNFFKWEDDGLR